MKLTDIILFIGFGMALAWGGFYVWMEGKKRTYVIYAGIIIDIILLAIGRNLLALFGGVLAGIIIGSVKEGGNVLFRKIGVRGKRDRMVMQGWKNWVIVSVITFVMMLSTISIVVLVQ